MDDERFDTFVREVVATRNRRAAVRLLAVATLGGVTSRFGRDVVAARCRAAGAKCRKKGQCCSRKCAKGKCACAKARHCTGGKVCRQGRCVCDPNVACGPACECLDGHPCVDNRCETGCDASKCEAPHLIQDSGEWVCRDTCTGIGNRCIDGACGCPPAGCPNFEACIDGRCAQICDRNNCQTPHYSHSLQRWVCLVCGGLGGYCVDGDCSTAAPASCINGYCGCPPDADFECGKEECCPEDDPLCCGPGITQIELCCGRGNVTCCAEPFCHFGCGSTGTT